MKPFIKFRLAGNWRNAQLVGASLLFQRGVSIILSIDIVFAFIDLGFQKPAVEASKAGA